MASNFILNLCVLLSEYGTPSTVIVLDAILLVTLGVVALLVTVWVVALSFPDKLIVLIFSLPEIFRVVLVVLPQLSSTVNCNIAENSVCSWTDTTILELSIKPSWSSVTFIPWRTSTDGSSTSNKSVNPSNTGALL